MDVEDSTKVRRRIVAFLLSRGGRATSGQNHGYVRWMRDKIATGKYVHEQVGYLKQTLVNMERDGIVTIEWALEKSTRITAVSLGVAADVSTIDEEDYDLFSTVEAVWILVNILRGQVQKQTAQIEKLQEDAQIMDELIAEDAMVATITALRTRIAELEQQPRQPVCTHDDALQAVKVRYEQIIDTLNSVHATALRRNDDEWRKKLQHQSRTHETYRAGVNSEKSRLGSQLAQLKRENQALKTGSAVPAHS